MAKDVVININAVAPIGTIGFGCPLILVENATKEIAYGEYMTLEEIVTAGFEASTDAYEAAQLMFMQTHAPKKIALVATTGTAEAWLAVDANVKQAWRQLIVVATGDKATNVAGVMAVIETQKAYPKMYFANVNLDDDTEFTVANIKRTVLCYYTPTENVPVPVAALVGEIAGLEVGSYTLNNLVVKGVDGYELSDSQILALHEKGGITFVESAGDVVASEGFAAGGEFVDITDGNDYVKQQLEYKTQKVFNTNLKVPYNDIGIALLESAANDVMKDAQNKGIVDSFTVQYLLRENTTEADRIARHYAGGNISYVMAGAIHTIEINCELTF